MKRELRTLKHQRNDLSRELDQLLAARVKGGSWNKAKYCQLTSSILTLQERIQRLKKPTRDRADTTPTFNMHLNDIENCYLHKTLDATDHVLTCPKCGDTDHGNRMDGQPWCINCNRILTTPHTATEASAITVVRAKRSSITFTEYDKAIRR